MGYCKSHPLLLQKLIGLLQNYINYAHHILMFYVLSLDNSGVLNVKSHGKEYY